MDALWLKIQQYIIVDIILYQNVFHIFGPVAITLSFITTNDTRHLNAWMMFSFEVTNYVPFVFAVGRETSSVSYNQSSDYHICPLTNAIIQNTLSDAFFLK